MNSRLEFDDRRQLDRLVDGELSEDEYRAFLAALARQPDGWRRCAIAFLEAQAWKREMDDLGMGNRSRRDTAVLVQRARRSSTMFSSSTRRFVGLILTVAAGFAGVFASGIWWHDHISDPEPDSPVAARREPEPRPSLLAHELSREEEPQLVTGDFPERLTLIVDRGNGESDRWELPVYDANDRIARELLDNSPSVPADIVRAIRDSGFQVECQRQWAPIRLHDGRRAFFPVDQLDITPVSDGIYH